MILLAAFNLRPLPPELSSYSPPGRQTFQDPVKYLSQYSYI